MYYDPLVALVNILPVEKLSDENSKKKSRWERNATNNIIENKVVVSNKWGSEDYKPYLPLPFVDFPPGLTPAQLDQFLREQRYDELTKKLNKGELEYVDPDIRPPSPPPIYDKNGSRINTREARIKNSMIEEHHRLIEYLLKHVDGFVAPPTYKPIKKIRKIEIPIDKYPEYNFMGLIIGPRGCNHKRLEAESGAQISIRGKGTLKEGKKTDHQTEIEAAMPKHVHIAADTEECVEKAVSLITPLLDPFHPLHEEYKRKGLEQLALVNGINLSQLDTQRCSICNSNTHLTFECPENMNIQNFKKPEIKCNLCGDHGHITLDCKLAKQSSSNYINKNDLENSNDISQPIHAHLHSPAPPPPPPPPPLYDPITNTTQGYNGIYKMDKIKMDLEYEKMMNELNGDHPNKDKKNDDIYKKLNENTMDNITNQNDIMNMNNDKYNISHDNNMIPTNSNNINDINDIYKNNNNNNNNQINDNNELYKNDNEYNNNYMNNYPININKFNPSNHHNMNNPNFIPLPQNNNENHFNNMLNFNNVNNIPLTPPLPPILPNFLNLPFVDNDIMINPAFAYQTNPPLSLDPLYMQNYANWAQMPMNYAEQLLVNAPAPDTNPPPLPSDSVGLNKEENTNTT
ncbi:transcription or splicing factor-like protein, putative [Plasmodium sp. gorilla clade G2]|uniref:transcription or splicing factor-like protein, putative n=1 Tax=Plasmodium sp. gorilla clade G2 TaxID=880535 RepID=UPI000D21AD26|nr:transcription or splicing factor-like protein, putative [Plasmodium sp. gorilla clade G2]SOV12645.1 transcription or splicing factor-like protein, putative [Plasmodium sp. gorilla clade G2]